MACTIHGNGIGFIPGAVFVWPVQKVDSVGDWTRSPREFATHCCTYKFRALSNPTTRPVQRVPVTGTRADSTG